MLTAGHPEHLFLIIQLNMYITNERYVIPLDYFLFQTENLMDTEINMRFPTYLTALSTHNTQDSY